MLTKPEGNTKATNATEISLVSESTLERIRLTRESAKCNDLQKPLGVSLWKVTTSLSP